jgi:murein DD-endopeptidase MepM/ murein hydrolase activator NlpD
MKDFKQLWKKISGKGYYIALILCAVAIGISGYLYYRNSSKKDAQLQDPGLTGPNVQALATDPSGGTNDPGNAKPEPLQTGMPVDGETVAGYAMDCLSYNPTTRDWRVHNGVDITAQEGTPVLAAADGVVYTTYDDDTLGTTVVIRHDDGYVTMYSSLDDTLSVKAGDAVKLGQTIGHVGDSALLESAIGDHVHFCVTKDGSSIDPERFFELG